MNECPCPALVDGTPDSVAAASAQIRLLMVEGDGPPGPWSDRPDAASVRRGDFNALSGRGLRSFPFSLNFSALIGIGGARRGCVARFKGVFRGCRVFSCVGQGSC
jgi:hypothetical protein